MRARFLLAGVISFLALEAAAEPSPNAQQARRRFALVVGANNGGPERVLRHAVADARTFSGVLTLLGGVRPEDTLLLADPDGAQLRTALTTLQRRLRDAREARGQVELVFYYSGHSDEQGLWLRGSRFGYAELRNSLAIAPADFRISVLDSCASGAFTRRKAGQRVSPFLVDSATRVTGEAVLTSSSASEASQESDRIGGSFFTHHLVAGLRGAADISRDGKVTLNEAYQFAFHETLARTEVTQAGAQHPAYEMAVAGTGDVVLTDLRGSGATLAVDAPLEGRLYLRDAAGKLVLELTKRAGAAVDLGLDEGAYLVNLARGAEWSGTSLMLSKGQRTILAAAQLKPMTPDANLLRGDVPFSVAAAARAYRFAVDVSFLGAAALPLTGPVTIPIGLQARYYPTPLVQVPGAPLELLEYLSRPDLLGLVLTYDYRDTRAGLSGQFFAFPNTAFRGHVLALGRSFDTYGSSDPRTAQMRGTEVSAGVLHHFSEAVRLVATYEHSGSVETGTSATVDAAEAGVSWLSPRRRLLATAYAGVHVEAIDRLEDFGTGVEHFRVTRKVTPFVRPSVTWFPAERLSLEVGAAVGWVRLRSWRDATTQPLQRYPDVNGHLRTRLYLNDWLHLEGTFALEFREWLHVTPRLAPEGPVPERLDLRIGGRL